MADILGPDGQEYEIDDSELDAALSQGFTVKPQSFSEKAADVVDTGRAAIEGLGRGATLGLTDYAQAAGAGLASVLGGNETPRAIGPGLEAPVDQTSPFMRGMREQKAEIDARAAAHPIASTGGEIAGAIAPMLLSGGATAAPTAAQAAMRLTPTAVTSSLAARAAARILPNAAASAAGRIGAMAAAGALENATQGAARRVFDSLAKGDHEISAERMVGGLGDVVSDAAIGGLSGGLLGGAIEGGQAAYGWAKTKGGELIERVAQKPAQDIPKEFKFNLELAQVDPEGAVEAAGPLTSRELGQVADNAQAGVYNDALRAARGAADTFGDTQQGAGRAISADMKALAREFDELDEGAGLVAKRQWAQGLGKGMMEEVTLPPAPHNNRAILAREDGAKAWANFEIPGENGPLGEASVSSRLPGLVTVRNIDVTEGGTGKGLGTELYSAIADYAEGNGRKLASDTFNMQSDAAKSWWEKQVKAGLATKDDELGRYVLTGRLPNQRPLPQIVRQPTGQLKMAADATVEKINQYMAQLNRLEAESPNGISFEGGSTTIGRLRAMIDDYKAQAQKALDEGDLGTFAWHTDRLKAAFQKAAKTRNSMLEPVAVANAEDFRLFLERNDVWGDAWADTQRRVNKAWTNAIRADRDASIGAFWKRGSDEAINPFEVLDRPNEQHIGNFLKGLGEFESEGDEAAFRKYLRAKALDAQNRAEAWGSPELQARAQSIAERAKRIEDSMNAVALSKKDKVAWDKVKDSLAMEMAGSVPVVGPVVKKGAKWVGSAVGRMAERAVPVEQAVAESAETAVRTMIRGGSPRMGAIAGAAAGEIKRALEQARELDDPESPASARLRAAVEEIAADDPDFAAMAQQKLKERAAFLNEKAGPAFDNADPFNPRVPPMPRTESAKLERYAQAAVAPAVALKRLGAGKGTAEDIETLQTLYPRLYQDFVQRVGQEIKATKKLPTMRQRQALHRATGIPAGRLFGPESVAFLQGEYAHPPPEPVQVNNPSAGAPPDPMGEGAPGRADAILAGG